MYFRDPGLAEIRNERSRNSRPIQVYCRANIDTEFNNTTVKHSKVLEFIIKTAVLRLASNIEVRCVQNLLVFVAFQLHTMWSSIGDLSSVN